jgi:phage terminase small subunit
MPILKNPRHEMFAQEVAKGSGVAEAYAAAGFKPNPGNARRLKMNEAVAKRVEALLDRRSRIEETATKNAVERLSITKERILEELASIAFVNMADYMRAGKDGDPYLDFSALTRAQAAALSEVTVEDFAEGRGENARAVRRIKFKLWDKKGALIDLGKHLGMFREKVDVSGTVDTVVRFVMESAPPILELEAVEVADEGKAA